MKRLGRQTTPGDAQTETALAVAHDYAPRRVEDVSGVPRADLPLLAFRACLDGLELLLVPNFGRAYAVTVRPEVAAVLTPELERAARALVPIVGADGDLGPLRRLVDVS